MNVISKINYKVDCESHCSGIVYNQHCHLNYTFLFVFEGKVNIILEGKNLTLKKNMGIFILPNYYHTVISTENTYNRLIVNFSAEIIPSAIICDFNARVKEYPLFLSQQTSSTLHRMFEIIQTKPHDIYSDLINALFIDILYTATFESAVSKSLLTATDKNDETIENLIAYINGNHHKQISIKELASDCFMSESSISHLFKKKMQISVKQYILQKKMLFALELLNNGNAPTAVAQKCGYENYASFYKAFKKTIGETPQRLEP